MELRRIEGQELSLEIVMVASYTERDVQILRSYIDAHQPVGIVRAILDNLAAAGEAKFDKLPDPDRIGGKA